MKCRHCSKEIEPGYVHCAQCRFVMAKASRRYRLNHPGRLKAMSDAKKRKRIDERRCRDCGTPLDEDADSGCVTCINCRQHLVL